MTVRAWGALFVAGCLAAIVAAQPACKKKSEPQATVATDVAPLPPPPHDVAPPPAADAAPAPAEATAGLDLSKEPIQPLPTDLHLDAKMVALGRRLFFDPQLSADGTVSCASCHALQNGGADGQPRSDGVGGRPGVVNAPTVLNSGFNFVQFWDGRAANLEEQAGGPVANPSEMAGDWDTIVEGLGKDETYVAMFGEAFPGSGISAGNIRRAIAEYERSLVTPSRFDAYLRGHTIELAVATMAHYQLERELTPEEQGKLVAFLKSLTGELPPGALPEPAAGLTGAGVGS